MNRRPDLGRAASYVVARRGALGFTQAALAAAAGVDIKTIYNLESAKRWPQTGNRSAIESALGWQQGDLAKIANGGEPTPPLTQQAGFETRAEFPLLNIRAGDTGTLSETATIRRYPPWFVREADRRGVRAEELDDAVETLRRMADDSGRTLGSLLVYVGMATEDDLVVKERPTPQPRSEALSEYDDGVSENVSSPHLTPRQREKARADAERRRRQSLGEITEDR
ncbi:helix-turn-helix domain-containing protein [Streptosporangium sp. CA-115845]|uniref:helix-turn-helix domain-containing protein n=1 Tax=Streptosporangium sp. CA-115845 TaxID=3240071 RepID=UPI003D8E9AEB